MKLAWRLFEHLQRLRTAETATAAVEFALILPIMLFLYIGSTEASVLISIDRKVQLISGTVGDLVARSKGEISAAVLGDYVKVASGLLSPYAAPNMVQIVTQVKVSGDGTEADVEWSRGFRNQEPVSALNRDEDSEYPLPDAVRNIAKGQWVIVAETSVDYTPLYGLFYTAPISLYRENFYLPRFEGSIELK